MYGADEKKAFEDMLAEIGEDSDEEEMQNYSRQSHAKPSARLVAESKSYQKHQSYSSGAKATASAVSSSGNGGFQSKQTSQMSKQEEEIARFGVESVQSAAQIQSEQINITKRWLTRSCSAGERNTMKCFVERERSSFGMQTTYRCYLEGSDGEGATNGSSGARFLMSAKKRVVNKTSYYLISLDNEPADDRGSESILGKVIGMKLFAVFLTYVLFMSWY